MGEVKVIDFLEAARDREQTRKRRVVLPHKTAFNLSQFVHDVWSMRQPVTRDVLWLEKLDNSLQMAFFSDKHDFMSSREIISQIGDLFVGFRFGSHQESDDVSSALLELDRKSVSAGVVKDPEFEKRIKAAVK